MNLDSYSWLTETLGEAGCVTVVAAPDGERLSAAFGCDPLPDRPRTYADMAGMTDPELMFLQAWFGKTDDAVVVVEDMGFEGSRAEVLRAASRASGAGVAASVLWNVEGLVIFTAARRGKVVCSVDLLDCDPVELPRPLRALAARASEEEGDLVGLGGAMVAKFTGVGLDRDALLNAVHRTITPVASDLETVGPEHSGLRYLVPALVEAIVAATPQQQRHVANWAARVAAVEAGVSEEPGVRALLEQEPWDNAPNLPPQLAGLLARWQRDQRRWGNEHEDFTANQSSGALEGVFLGQKVWAGEALTASTHPDPQEAALQVVYAAVLTVGSSARRRGGKFIKDERGRRRVYEQSSAPPRLGPRSQGFVDLALVALAVDPAPWPALSAQLPVPFTPSERKAAIQHDQERQARGDFTTYSFERPRHR